MISMNDVTKIYENSVKKGWFRKEKQRKIAVEQLSLQIKKGEIIGLLGLNGAGKTTTIKMLSTLLLPTEGTITIDGLDVQKDQKQILQKINMIAGGERMLYWRLTGWENLMYFGRMYGLSENVIPKRIASLLKEVGLTESANIPVERYSKGMKQRLQIARGLINDPDYLFLDEPTLGLDAPIARQLRVMINRLAKEQGKGILLTSHYLQEVEELCDRVVLLNEGKVMMNETPETIIRRIAGYEVVHFHLDRWNDAIQNQLAPLFQLDSDTIETEQTLEFTRVSIKSDSVDRLISKIIPWFMEQGLILQHFSTQKPTLEDAIVRLSEGGGQDEFILANVSG